MRRKLIILFFIFSYTLLISMPYTVQGNIQIPKAYIQPNGIFDESYSLYAVNDTDGFNDDEFHFTDYPYAELTDYTYKNYPELPYTESHAIELEEINNLYH